MVLAGALGGAASLVSASARSRRAERAGCGVPLEHADTRTRKDHCGLALALLERDDGRGRTCRLRERPVGNHRASHVNIFIFNKGIARA